MVIITNVLLDNHVFTCKIVTCNLSSSSCWINVVVQNSFTWKMSKVKVLNSSFIDIYTVISRKYDEKTDTILMSIQ